MSDIEHCVVDLQRFKEAVWAAERENFRPGNALDALERATVETSDLTPNRKDNDGELADLRAYAEVTAEQLQRQNRTISEALAEVDRLREFIRDARPLLGMAVRGSEGRDSLGARADDLLGGYR